MKLFIKHLCSFLVVAIVFYCILIIFVGEFAPHQFKKNLFYNEKGYGHTYSRLHDADTIKNIDVLILGSSHAYRGFDTRIFEQHNIKAFNLGTSAQTVVQTEMLVDRYLEKLNPKIVIYEVFPGLFSSDGVESALDVISNSPKIGKPEIKMAFKSNSIKVYNTLIYSFYKTNIKKNNELAEPVIKGMDTYVSGGGFVEREITYNKDRVFPKSKWHLNNKQLLLFENIIEKISKSGSKLLLIQAPITKRRYNSFTNSQEVDLYFSKKGAYYNYNTILNLNDTLHFYDPQHLNQNGVNLFTEEVIKLLNKEDFIK